ncbi:hypothetical protein TNCT_584741 [Trichonephila clavata]|uniref:Uncharacterized protein n=1 Tax=Trichonephila clavata TaxID=2740835 RepID=A0A8X6LJC7_TRICU|nr:hypothetical protein TNCT_584741 [Trichonephila clavata]
MKGWGSPQHLALKCLGLKVQVNSTRVNKLQGSLHPNLGTGHLRGCTLKKFVATGSPSTTVGFGKLCRQQMFSKNEERC